MNSTRAQNFFIRHFMLVIADNILQKVIWSTSTYYGCVMKKTIFKAMWLNPFVVSVL